MNIYDLISRAQKLRKETQLDSVSPDRVGGLHEDTLKYINEFQLLASSPSLHKIYASVSAMQSDKSPKSDLTGKPLKPGQLVVIVPANQTDATAGDVYRYDGPSGNTSAWTFVAKIGAVPADAELSATSTNPPQNKVVTEKLTELESESDEEKAKLAKLASDVYKPISLEPTKILEQKFVQFGQGTQGVFSETTSPSYSIILYPVQQGKVYKYKASSALSETFVFLSFFENIPSIGDLCEVIERGKGGDQYYDYKGVFVPKANGYIGVQPKDSQFYTIETVSSELLLDDYITKENAEKAAKNIEGLWMNKTILTYRKPNTKIDNVVNFDNLMVACQYAMQRANFDNQYEIQVYEDIYVKNASEYTLIDAGYYSIMQVKEYVKVRGMGFPTLIHAEIDTEKFTGNRVDYQLCQFDGGELENLILESKNIRYPIHFERAGDAINQNVKSIVRNCRIHNLGGDGGKIGNEASAYTAWDAWGMGSSQGLSIVFEGCEFIGARHGFRCHTAPNTKYVFPTRMEFNNCSFIGLGGSAMYLDEYGSEQINEYILNGCNLQGVIYNICDSSLADTIPFGISIKGSNNIGVDYQYYQNNALRCIANRTSVLVFVAQDDCNLFGIPKSRRGDNGIHGYVCGTKNVTSSNRTLGKRIGDCSSVNKTLAINIGGVLYKKIFSSNYTNLSNDDILTELNAVVEDVATFDLYNFNSEYYPEFTDILYNKRNGTNSVIEKGAYVKASGKFDVVATEESNAEFLAVTDVGIGQIGKFKIL